MKTFFAMLLTLSFASQAAAHYGPDLTQTSTTGLTPVQIAISQPLDQTRPSIPVAACPVPYTPDIQVACAE